MVGTTETSGHKRLFRSLQAGRGIAALMVVFYHCEGLFSLSKYWHWIGRHYFHFGYSGVGFFFVLSGVVILHAHWSDLGNRSKLGDYAWKRFRRIYPIYWVVLLAMLPLYFLVPSFGSGFEKQPAVILDSFLLMPLTRVATIIPVAWTLFHEVMFYIVFSFLLLRRNIGFAILGLWMAGSVVAFLSPPHNQILNTYFSPLHLLFGLGMLVLLAVRRTSLPGLPFAIVGVSGFLGCAILDMVREQRSPNFLFVYAISSAITVLGFMLLEKTVTLPIPAFLMFLGDASYSLYLVHYMVLSAAAKFIYPLWRHHPVPLAIPFTALMLIAVASGIAVHLFVERPLLRWLSSSGPKSNKRTSNPLPLKVGATS